MLHSLTSEGNAAAARQTNQPAPTTTAATATMAPLRASVAREGPTVASALPRRAVPPPMPRKDAASHAGAPSASQAAMSADAITVPIRSAMKMSLVNPLAAIRRNEPTNATAATRASTAATPGLRSFVRKGWRRSHSETMTGAAISAVRTTAEERTAQSRPSAESALRPNSLCCLPGDGKARANLAVGSAHAREAERQALMAGDLGAVPERLRTGYAHDHALMAGDLGGAPQGLRAYRTGGGPTLARHLQAVDGGAARAHDAVAPVLTPHEDRGAHVLAPLEPVSAPAPTEHAASLSPHPRTAAALPGCSPP